MGEWRAGRANSDFEIVPSKRPQLSGKETLEFAGCWRKSRADLSDLLYDALISLYLRMQIAFACGPYNQKSGLCLTQSRIALIS
jgi:hypothetical protein